MKFPVVYHLLKRLLKVVHFSLLYISRNVSKMKQNSKIYYSTMWSWSKYEVGSLNNEIVRITTDLNHLLTKCM